MIYINLRMRDGSCEQTLKQQPYIHEKTSLRYIRMPFGTLRLKMNSCNLFFLICALSLASCSPPVLRTAANNDEFPVQTDNTTEVYIPESTSKKVPLSVTPQKSVSVRSFNMHTRQSRKAHDALEHVVQTIENNTTQL